MPINFSNFEKPEGITDEVLANPKLVKFINDSIETEKTAAVSLIEAKRGEAVTAKAIADQKLQDMQAKLDEAVNNPATNDDKVKELQRKLDTAKDDAGVEYGVKIDALTKQLEEQKGAAEKLQQNLTTSEITSFLNTEISNYNSKNPTVRIKDGAESYLIAAGLESWRKTEDGAIRAFDGDTALTGSEGFISGVEYFSSLRDQPSASLFFEQPTGGGAAGGKGGGASQQQNLGGSTKERTQALKNKFPELASG